MRFLSSIALCWLSLCALAGAAPAEKPRFVATVAPLAMILRELTAGRAEVRCLLPPNASPHTYEPRPSDARAAEKATGFFWVSPLLDGWAAKLSVARKVRVLDFLPTEYAIPAEAHAHDGHPESSEPSATDPHFWTDPLAVKAILPRLAAELTRWDPDGREVYRKNAEAFATRLDALHEELRKTLAPVRGQAVLLFHPSFLYLLHRYGLVFAGAIEPFPGKEPSAGEIQELIRRVKRTGARAVFNEPQLPPQPARVMAEAAGLKLRELDPNGGVEGRRTYAELLGYNARALAEALGDAGTEAQRHKGTKQ